MRHFKLTGLTVMAALLCGSCCQEALEGGWVSTDRHFTLKADGTSCKTGLDKAMLQDSAFAYAAWRGEKTSAQALVWAGKELKDLHVTDSSLKSDTKEIPADRISASFIK